jgi:hypothetical protein
MSAKGTWSCRRCTFENSLLAVQCSACGFAWSAQKNSESGLGGLGDSNLQEKMGSEGWACGKCTFENAADTVRCEVCDHERPQASTMSGEDGGETLERKRKRHTESGTEPDRLHRQEESRTQPDRGTSVGNGRTVIVLDDDESPKQEAKGKDAIQAGAHSHSGAGGSGVGSAAGPTLLHQLHLERLARQAAKHNGTVGDAANLDSVASSLHKSNPSQVGGREKASVNMVSATVGGLRERAGSSTFHRPDLDQGASAPGKQTVGAAVRSFASTSAGATAQSAPPENLVILSYNVWFNEAVELQRRMGAIGEIIERHSPDVIFFQEVTPSIYTIFRQSRWWGRLGYKCSLAPAQIDRQYFAMMVRRTSEKRFSMLLSTSISEGF